MKRLPSFSLCSEVVFVLPWQQRKLFKLQRRECWEERKWKIFEMIRIKFQDCVALQIPPSNQKVTLSSNSYNSTSHCLSSSLLLLLKHFIWSAASEYLPLCCSRINSALLFPQYYVCWAARLIYFPFSCRGENDIFMCIIENRQSFWKTRVPIGRNSRLMLSSVLYPGTGEAAQWFDSYLGWFINLDVVKSRPNMLQAVVKGSQS